MALERRLRSLDAGGRIQNGTPSSHDDDLFGSEDAWSGVGASSASTMMLAMGTTTCIGKGLSVSASGGGIQNTVTCACCKQQLPASVCTPKGSAWWCRKDNAAYGDLAIRWKLHPRLREWWTKLSAESKVAWFIKWQGMDAKNRFDGIEYSEIQTEAAETLDDHIHKWEVWDDFWARVSTQPGMTWALAEQSWQDRIINAGAAAMYNEREKQWCVPRYAGFERRTRARKTFETEQWRTASIKDPESLQQRITAGQQLRDRFLQALPHVPVAPPLHNPEVQARPEDMPPILPAPDTLADAIQREAII